MQQPTNNTPARRVDEEPLSFELHQRRRNYNRGPLEDLFPRIPATSLERVLDLTIAKPFSYNLSEAKIWNARRLTSIVVAHVRHAHTDYDQLLREGVERFEARERTQDRVWSVLRKWCPWDDSNDVLERCFQATLLRLENRRKEDWLWDPMELDDESYYATSDVQQAAEVDEGVDVDAGDPMDLD